MALFFLGFFFSISSCWVYPGLVLWFFKPVRWCAFYLNFSPLVYLLLTGACPWANLARYHSLFPTVYFSPVSIFVLSLVPSGSCFFYIFPKFYDGRRVGPIEAAQPLLHRLPLALDYEMRRWNQMPPSHFPSCAKLAACGPGQWWKK